MTKHVNIFIEYINYLNQIQKKSARISLYIYIYIIIIFFFFFFWLSIFNYAMQFSSYQCLNKYYTPKKEKLLKISLHQIHNFVVGKDLKKLQ